MKTRKYPTSRKLIALLGDIAIIIGTYIIAMIAIVPHTTVAANFAIYSDMMVVNLVLTVMMFIIYDLYTIEYKRYSEIVLTLAVALFLVLVLTMALSFLVHDFAYSRVLIAVSIAADFVLLAIWRRALLNYERRIHSRMRETMIIGMEQECQHIYYRMSAQPQLRMRLRHVVLNYEKDWTKAMSAHHIDIVILCPSIPVDVRESILNYCTDKEIQPYIVPTSYEIFCNGATLQKIDDIPVFRPKSLRLSLEQRVMKRAVDIVLAGIAFLIALPIMLVVGLAVKLGDGGPALYSQVRVGRFGKEYKVYKFRSMRIDAEKYSGPQLATDHDPRITRVGNFIRATRLDELPQIWNVLTGDMSLVGPRPERPYFVDQFKAKNPEYAYRHNVKPGITGLAQVFAKYNTTPYDKLVYDLMYIENYTLTEDFIIMVQTIKILVTKSATEGGDVSGLDMDLRKFER